MNKIESKLLGQIVKKLGKNGIIYFLKHGKYPGVILSKDELDFLKGNQRAKEEFSKLIHLSIDEF